MKEASPRAHLDRLIGDSNYVGAHLYLKEAELEKAEYSELVGVLAGAVANELSRTRRDDRERVYFLRSTLAWILRDVPGLGPLYREQLRESRGSSGLLSQVSRGLQNAGDVATGRKTVSEGFQDAADDVRRSFEDAADSVKSGEAGSRINDFLKSAESGIRQGLDQLGEFFKTMNESASDQAESEGPNDESDAERAARAAANGDVEDASFEADPGTSDGDTDGGGTEGDEKPTQEETK